VQSTPELLLSVRGLEKVYPNGTAALKGATFDLASATIHGLVGANGAGKSTLIKILSGAIRASGGSVVWQGETRTWRSPAEALHSGIATIHQHIPLATTLSVIENVFLAADQPWRRSGVERETFARLTADVGYEIDPDAIVGDLPIGRRQVVSVQNSARAFAGKCATRKSWVIITVHTQATDPSPRAQFHGDVEDGIHRYLRSSAGARSQQLKQAGGADYFDHIRRYSPQSVDFGGAGLQNRNQCSCLIEQFRVARDRLPPSVSGRRCDVGGQHGLSHHHPLARTASSRQEFSYMN
jgi:ABC-type ATPase involved in cell division